MSKAVPPESIAKLYVRNLHYSLTERDVVAFFEQVGRVLNVRLARDKATGAFRGFAFVEIDLWPGTIQGWRRLQGAELQGRKVTIDFARSGALDASPESSTQEEPAALEAGAKVS